MKIPSVHVKKLDDRSKGVMYFGREPGPKAHRLYDPEEKRICVIRDVVFLEIKSWSWNKAIENAEAAPEQVCTHFTVETEEEQIASEVTTEVLTPVQSPISS